MLLRMLGADVVKVEPPGGDFGRMVPPYAGDTARSSCASTGARPAVRARPHRRAGRAELARAAGRCRRLPAQLAARARRRNGNWIRATWPPPSGLVYATASGWGEPAQDRRLIGTDFLVQAYTGRSGDGLSSPPGGRHPVRPRDPVRLHGRPGRCRRHPRPASTGGRRPGGRAPSARHCSRAPWPLQAHVFEGMARAARRRAGTHGRPVWGPLDRPRRRRPTASSSCTADDDAAFRPAVRACARSTRPTAPATTSSGTWSRRLAGPGRRTGRSCWSTPASRAPSSAPTSPPSPPTPHAPGCSSPWPRAWRVAPALTVGGVRR